jgi:hypothetical protein
MSASRGTYLGLFLLAGSVLMAEIALTRVMSVMLWGNYAFMVISTAMLGFGAAGTYLSIRQQAFSEQESRAFIGRNCLLFAVTLIVCVMIATRLGYDPVGDLSSWSNTLRLPLIYALLAVPFYFAGLAIVSILSRFSGQINSIYFADLVGAGTGALAVTLFLNYLGAPATLLVSSTLALLSRILLLEDDRTPRDHAAVAFFALAILGVTVADPWRITVPPSKGLHHMEPLVVDTQWSLLARIDVLESAERSLSFGSGVARDFYDRKVEYRSIYMDGSNPSRMLKAGQDPWFIPKLLSATPYYLRIDSPKVLTIGAGGGIDTMVALHYGASSVTAVEINPATVDLVKTRYSDYLGGLFEQPNVQLIAKEGRHLLTLDQNRYDVIRLTGVDTKAAAAIGANALDHAYLYTTDAIHDLWDHLSDDGVLSMNRGVGFQRARLLTVMLAALDELGVEEPQKHFLAANNGRWTDILLRRRPYSREEVDHYLEAAAEAKFEVEYDPFSAPRDNLANVIISMNKEERAAFVDAVPVNLRPVGDDSPFFFETSTLANYLRRALDFEPPEVASLPVGNPAIQRELDKINKITRSKYVPLKSGYGPLLVALAQAAILSAIFILLPLSKLRLEVRKNVSPITFIGYFSMLGMAFVLAELMFIQKNMIFLGGPTYSLSISLFSILVFSGLGSFATRMIDIDSPRLPVGIVLTVVVLLIGYNYYLRDVLPLLLDLGFGQRIALAIISLAPASFFMGMPFPVGIKILDQQAPNLIPWAWASNACITVIGSVLSVVLAMNWGFFAVLNVAAACYLVAALLMLRITGAESFSKATPSSQPEFEHQ